MVTKAKPKEKSKINKSAWIREQPKALTAKELVERAGTQGITLTMAQVYTARSDAKKTGGSVSAAAPVKGKPGRKPKVAAIAPGEKVNKSAWIREQPLTLSAKEVVEKAKAEKIAITISQVYTARHGAKAKAKAEGSTTAAITPVVKVKGKPGRKPGPKPQNGGASAGSIRQEVIRFATRVGTDQLRAIADQIDNALLQ